MVIACEIIAVNEFFLFSQAVYMLIFLPICGTLVLCTKLLTLIPYDTVTNIFSETEWSEFFINSNVCTWFYSLFLHTTKNNVYSTITFLTLIT